MNQVPLHRRYWPTLIGVIVTICCACVTLSAVASLYWKPVQATVLDTTIVTNSLSNSYSNRVQAIYVVTMQYSYSYANRTFRSKRVLDSIPYLFDQAKSLANQYPPGKILKVWVNPLYPNQSTLHPGEDLINTGIILLCAGLVTSGIAMAQFYLFPNDPE